MVNRFRLTAGVVILLALVFAANGCARKIATPEPAPQPVRKFKVAFIYTGTVNDAGWAQTQDRGRQYLQELLPDVETSYMEAVSPGDDARRMLIELAEKGNKVIFATDSSYSDAAVEAAKQYPKTVFIVYMGVKTAPNVGVYAGRMYQPRYLAGLVAGMMTRHDLIGYVAADPALEEIIDLNAFALGVQKVNREAMVKVIWTGSCLEPQKEKDAIKKLIGAGADIIVQQRDDPAVRPAGSERTVDFIGTDGDLSMPVPLSDLACTGWNLGTTMAAAVSSVQDGTWESGRIWVDMSDEAVNLAPLNPIVPERVRSFVESQKQQLTLGKIDVFAGPIKDQDGQVRVEPGQKITDEELLNMDWLVEGIDSPPIPEPPASKEKKKTPAPDSAGDEPDDEQASPETPAP